jgi:hypothetical protein
VIYPEGTRTKPGAAPHQRLAPGHGLTAPGPFLPRHPGVFGPLPPAGPAS